MANLTVEIAERQRQQTLRRLHALNPPADADIAIESFPAYSRGTVLLPLAEFELSQACFFALGAPRKAAERVADEAVDAFIRFIKSDGAIDAWLADQIILPLAMAKEPSVIRTSAVTQHLLTNAAVIGYFLPVKIELEAGLNAPSNVSIHPDQ